MPKAKSKKGKKAQSKKAVPLKTVFDILLDEYKDPQSLTLAQQKYVIDVLGLDDNSLYDSISIDIITECVRYCMKIQLDPKQIQIIYHILQNALYKIKNDPEFDQQQFAEYFDQQLSLKLPVTPTSEDPNKSKVETCTEANKEKKITASNFQSIVSFIEERIVNDYTVYRAALFQNNPSNIQYEKFKKNFEVGDIVQFYDDQYLSQIKEFKDNHVVLQLLDQENQIEITVSKDQTKFLHFVRKGILKPDQKQTQNEVRDNPTLDDHKMEMDPDEIDEVNDNDNDNEEELITESVEKEHQVEIKNKTLIDRIIDQRMEKKLESMQSELDCCKQEIARLKLMQNNA